MGEADLYQLIRECLQQNRKSQKLLYKEFYGFAMGICLRYANNRYEAAEVMNLGFMKVFTHLKKFDDTRPFKAWVGRIMTNAAIDYYRSNLKMAYTEDLEKAEHVAHDDLPDQKVSYNDLLSMVQQLPPAYRTVFNLYAIEGYTHEEIGDFLQISAGTSKSNLFKAREKLKKMLRNAAELPKRTDGINETRIVAVDLAGMNFRFLNSSVRL